MEHSSKPPAGMAGGLLIDRPLQFQDLQGFCCIISACSHASEGPHGAGCDSPTHDGAPAPTHKLLRGYCHVHLIRLPLFVHHRTKPGADRKGEGKASAPRGPCMEAESTQSRGKGSKSPKSPPRPGQTAVRQRPRGLPPGAVCRTAPHRKGRLKSPRLTGSGGCSPPRGAPSPSQTGGSAPPGGRGTPRPAVRRCTQGIRRCPPG